jgi:hypothetical protein
MDMKALAGIVGLAFAAGCMDPDVGDAFWQSSPPGGVPDGSSMKSYSEPGSGGWIVKTVGYDGRISCGEVKDVAPGGLTAVLNDRALEARGEVPITADPQVAEVASAQMTVGNRHYTSGTVTLTELDGTIDATFVATFEQTTLTGWFHATHCP